MIAAVFTEPVIPELNEVDIGSLFVICLDGHNLRVQDRA